MGARATGRLSAGARRQAVIDAATVEFAVGGLHGTSTEAIARRAGISHPYIFRLFGTKKRLFLAVVERCFRRTLATFEEAATQAKRTRDPAAVLRAMGKAYIDLLADREMLLVQLHAYAACADPDVEAVVRRGYGEIYELVQRVSGADADEIRHFFATGMLLNVIAAMNLGTAPEPWAKRLTTPFRRKR
jgi:AcrR family transcriptional regulator